MINKTEIEKAQNSWGNGIITIGKLKDNPKECRIFTVNFISKHYDFDSLHHGQYPYLCEVKFYFQRY